MRREPARFVAIEPQYDISPAPHASTAVERKLRRANLLHARAPALDEQAQYHEEKHTGNNIQFGSAVDSGQGRVAGFACGEDACAWGKDAVGDVLPVRATPIDLLERNRLSDLG